MPNFSVPIIIDQYTADGAIIPNPVFHRAWNKLHSRCVEYPFTASQLTPEALILDLGSDKADKIWIDFLNSLSSRTIFFDYDHSRPDSVNFIRGDCRFLPFGNNTFDFICAVSFIEHIGLQNAQTVASPGISQSGDLETLAEFARVLKPDGKLILTVPMGRRSGYFSGGTARAYVKNDISRFSALLNPSILDYYEYRLRKKGEFYPIGKENNFGTEGLATWQRISLDEAQAKNDVTTDGILLSVWVKYACAKPLRASHLSVHRDELGTIYQKRKNMEKQLIIIGNSSAAVECYRLAQRMIQAGEHMEIKGFLSFEGYSGQLDELSLLQLGIDDDYEIHAGDVFCIGIGIPELRLKVFEKWKKKGAKFINLMHPKCKLTIPNELGEANIFMANVFVSSNVVIGNANYFSPNVNIGHEAVIGNGNLLYSDVIVSDYCTVGNCNQFDANSVMLPKTKIGNQNIIRSFSHIKENLGNNNIVLINKKTPRDKIQAIDLQDCFSQFRNTGVINASRHYYHTEYRRTALLKERAKRAAEQTYDVIEKEMFNSFFEMNQFVPVQQLKDTLAWQSDVILDLGVYKGFSTKKLASIFPEADIHGFDSFEGLPVNWTHAAKGAFGEIRGILPDVPDYVTLHKGWFQDTFPAFRQYLQGRRICLLRIDCDVYESAKLCLDTFLEFCAENCIIIFDEYFGYFAFQEHEYKAFAEAKKSFKLSYEWKAYGLSYALLQLTAKPAPIQFFNISKDEAI